MKIKFGVKLNIRKSYREVRRLAQKCEKLGFYSAYMFDHPSNHWLECWTTLAALAEATRRIRLGPLVTCISYRNPSLVAKMGASLDRVSKGRLEFGIGAGWNRDEYVSYGYRFPNTETRTQQLREGIEIIKMMWTMEKPTFTGKHYTIKEAVCTPKPIQKPHPPILIGGSGERHILKAVAEYSDICNMSGSPHEYKRKLQILRNYCAKIGRDFNQIEKSWTGDILILESRDKASETIETYRSREFTVEQYVKKHIIGTLEECRAKLETYINLGVKYFTVSIRTLENELQLFAEEVIKNIG
jgi:F420-dependent oxidoreductase-like protein